MKASEKLKRLPGKVKSQLRTALLLVCAIATFAVPAFGGGYSVLKDRPLTSSAASTIEEVDLLLVGATAFGEARKVITASDNEAIDIFIDNTAEIIGTKWQNVGLLVGTRDSLSGTTWNIFQSPITLSATEVATYNNSTIADAYNKYKAFGFAIQNLNQKALRSNTSAVSVDDGLDAMSTAAIKLGSFGVEFLNDFNPGPVLLSLYDSSNLARYPDNKLVQIVTGNQVLKNIVCLFGDQVAGTRVSFFIIFNAVLAVAGLGLSMLLTLLGNRNIGDGIRHFIVRIAIGSAGIYIIANIMSVSLNWVSSTILNVAVSQNASYVENNLNLYDWYLTGFSLPTDIRLEIDSSGKFVFTADIVRKINYYTYNRLVGGATDELIKERMETYTQNSNSGISAFFTPSRTVSGSGDGDAAGEVSNWSTDAYYAIMKNYAENKEDLLEGRDDEGSPLYRKWSVKYSCQYFYMSSLSMTRNSSTGGWTVRNIYSSSDYYGLNPISALNLVRSDFSGESITSTAIVYPALAYVGFDIVNQHDASGSTNMNSITKFIASFTLILAAMKGLITIFTAGFGGLLTGGIKTAGGSAHGLGQALGAVFAIIFGVIGISVIMSMSLSLLDTVYGVCKNLLVGTEVVDEFLEPVRESVGDIPIIGSALVGLCHTIVDLILSLILALTFPKLGGIPITTFSQFMADLPGRIAEKAQMIEGQLMSGRGSAGGGLGHGPRGAGGGRGQYGKAAQQMAGQAFSNGARQAASVVSAGAKTAGALAGASLAAAGRAANKKADSLEGKPKNPGVDNWDDLSPEQQAAAAEAAAAVDNWNDMDEEARQNALKEAGVYGDNNADSGSTTQDGEGSIEGEETDAPESISDAEGAAPEEEVQPAEGTGDEIPADVSAEDSITGTEDTDMPPVEGDAESLGGDAETEGAAAGDMEGQSLGGEGEESTEPAEAGEAAEGSISNNMESTQFAEGANQQFDTSIDQFNNMDEKSVDESKELNEDSNADFENTDMDNRSTANSTSMADVAAGAGSMSAQEAQEAKAQAGSAHGTADARTRGAADARQTSVTNNTNKGGNSSVNVNSKNQQNNRVNAGADNSRTSINNTAQQAAQQAQKPAAKPAAAPNQQRQANNSQQSMNGTSTSAWGKEMTVREQRQARAMHAVGDALQMMGGNRSMSDGVKEALGHAKDAAIAYAVPIELQDPGKHPFIGTIHNKRQQSQQAKKQAKKQSEK